MNVADIAALFDYGYWANRKLFDVLAGIPADEFTREIAGSYGSIRNTLVHALSAEWGWLDRCGGHFRGPALKASDYPDVASLLHTWQLVEGHVRTFLAQLSESDLTRRVEFSFGGGPTQVMTVAQLMQHAANHSVHHRAQVALLLRTLGHAPGNIDLLMYFGELGGVSRSAEVFATPVSAHRRSA